MSYEFLEKGLFVTNTDRSYFIPYGSITSIETSTNCKPLVRIYYVSRWNSIDITYDSIEEMNVAMKDFVRNFDRDSKESCELLSHAKRRIVDLSE